MAKIACWLPGEPPTATKQQRKHRVITPKGGKPFAMTYKEKKVVDAEQSLLAKFLPHRPAQPLAGPLSVELIFRFTRPKSHTKKQRQCVYKTTKPDLDNAEKVVIDAIAGVAFLDDAQICRKRSAKIYCADDQEPGIGIIIEECDELTW